MEPPYQNNQLPTPVSSVQSVLIIEDEDRFPVLLKYTTSKNMFLTKVSFYFMIYMIFVSSVCMLLFENMNLAKLYYRLWNLNYIEIFVYIVLGCIKLSFLITGGIVRKWAGLIFCFDCFLTMLATLAFYFRLDNFISLPYVYTGHYLIIFASCLAMSSIAFFLTTIYRDGTNIYSVGKGFVFMCICDLVPIYFYQERWLEIRMTNTRYTYIWLVMVVVNFYIARNSWVLVNCRGEKFYDHEHIYAFECYFTDIFWGFWVDRKDDNDKRRNKSYTDENSKTETEQSEISEKKDESKPDSKHESSKADEKSQSVVDAVNI